MTKHIAIFETERAEFREAFYATERSAAMLHLSCYYNPGEDPVKWLPEQMPAFVDHLHQTPTPLRCLYLNFFGTWEYGGPKDEVAPTYSTVGPLKQADYLTMVLRNNGMGRGDVPFCYLDHEKVDLRGLAARSRFLRTATAPLKTLLGCERVNYTDATFKGSLVEWSGFRRLTGSTIDRTDSVDCYTKKPGDFVRVCRNVEACRKTGRVIPHLPPKITEAQTQAEAESQIRAMIHRFTQRGITTFFVAAYEWPKELRPRLVRVVTDALAEAEAIMAAATDEGVNG